MTPRDPQFHVVQLHMRELERSVERYRDAAGLRSALRQITAAVRTRRAAV